MSGDWDKPWAVVLMQLNGTAPPPMGSPGSVGDVLARLFRRGEFGGTSIADFWADQSLGVIDVSASQVFDWRDCGWDLTTYPGGKAWDTARHDLAEHAKQTLPNSSAFRGVIAVYNFPCNAGADGTATSSGAPTPSVPSPPWGLDTWRRCETCRTMVEWLPGAPLKPCPGGGAAPRRHPGGPVPHGRERHPQSRSLTVCAGAAASSLPSCWPEPAPVRLVGAHTPSGTTPSPFSRGGRTRPPRRGGPSAPGVGVRSRTMTESAWRPGAAMSGQPSRRSTSRSPRRTSPARTAVGFFCHEMGHGYEFSHGRGLQPRTPDPATTTGRVPTATGTTSCRTADATRTGPVSTCRRFRSPGPHARTRTSDSEQRGRGSPSST